MNFKSLLDYFVDKSKADTGMYQGNNDIVLNVVFVAVVLLIILVTYCLIKFFRTKRSIDKDMDSIKKDLESLEESLKSDNDEADAMQKRIRSLYYELRELGKIGEQHGSN